jgi:hypothetical protein
MKMDLIGNYLTVSETIVWRFDALSEFEDFSIKSKQTQGTGIEYDVSMRLKNLSTNMQYLVDAYITYERVDGQWKFKSIQTKLFRQL